MSNLNEAALAWLKGELLNVDKDPVKVESVAVVVEHYQDSGCSCCGSECDLDVTFDIWYERKVTAQDLSTYARYGKVAPDPLRDVESFDAEEDKGQEFLNFLADWTPSA